MNQTQKIFSPDTEALPLNNFIKNSEVLETNAQAFHKSETFGPITVHGGHQVTFYKEYGQWHGLVKEKLHHGLKRELNPFIVRYAVGYNLKLVYNKSKLWQKSHINIVWPENTPNGQGLVLVGFQQGLLGGGQNQSHPCSSCHNSYYTCRCGFSCPNRKCFPHCEHHCNRCSLCHGCCHCSSGCRCIKEEQERKERLERERREQERRQQEYLKQQQQRLEQQRREQQQQEQQRLEKQRLEQERRERERRQQEYLRQQKLEQQRREQERRQQEYLRQQRLEQQRREQQRLERQRLEKQRLEKERREQERREQEQREQVVVNEALTVFKQALETISEVKHEQVTTDILYENIQNQEKCLSGHLNASNSDFCTIGNVIVQDQYKSSPAKSLSILSLPNSKFWLTNYHNEVKFPNYLFWLIIPEKILSADATSAAQAWKSLSCYLVSSKLATCSRLTRKAIFMYLTTEGDLNDLLRKQFRAEGLFDHELETFLKLMTALKMLYEKKRSEDVLYLVKEQRILQVNTRLLAIKKVTFLWKKNNFSFPYIFSLYKRLTAEKFHSFMQLALPGDTIEILYQIATKSVRDHDFEQKKLNNLPVPSADLLPDLSKITKAKQDIHQDKVKQRKIWTDFCQKILFSNPESLVPHCEVNIQKYSALSNCFPSLDKQECAFFLKYFWIAGLLSNMNTNFTFLEQQQLCSKLSVLDLPIGCLRRLLRGVNEETSFKDLLILIDLMANPATSLSVIEDLLVENDLKECERESVIKNWTVKLQTTLLCKQLAGMSAKKSLINILSKLLKTGISYDFLVQHLSQLVFNKKSAAGLLAVFKLLSDYRMESMIDCPLLTSLTKQPVENWLSTAHDWLINATFKEEHTYSTEELIDKIAQVCSEISYCSKENLKSYYQDVIKAFKAPSQALLQINASQENINDATKEGISTLKNKPINTWETNDICQWVRFGKRSTERISQEEHIAVVTRGVELCHEITVRDTQLLAVGMLLNPEVDQGRLAQINTGEGKSLIVAMLAVIHALQGKKVDVVTTSIELSKRETKKQSSFFELFNLSVGENSKFSTKQAVYTKDIVYGTAGNFQGDILRTEFQGKDIRGQRGCEVVLVDEVDNMLFDKRTQSTRLCDQTPGMDHLERVLGAIWNHISLTIGHIVKDPKKNLYIFIADDFIVDETGEIYTDTGQPVDTCSISIEDPIEFIKKHTQTHIGKVIRDLNAEETIELNDYLQMHSQAVELSETISQLKDEIERKADKSKRLAKEEKVAALKQVEIDLQQHGVETTLKPSVLNEKRSILKDKHDQLTKEVAALQEEINRSAPLELYNEKLDKEKILATLNKRLNDSPWVKNRYPVILIPFHLREFARHQIPYWIESALGAKTIYQKDRHYAVEDGKIVPINYHDTGVFQPDMVWSNGLAQFLQIKENLKITPENLATNYLSTSGFFKRYGNNIYGMTGTLGTEATQTFFNIIYGTDQVIIPPYKECTILRNEDSLYLCKEISAIVCEDREQWYETICETTVREANFQRAVLVICQYVAQVIYFAKRLETQHPSELIFTYTGRGKFEKENIESGEIILATNIAGRGTDLTTSDVIENHGGLHVCITFLPESYRVELQNAGRTARQGKKGSTQLILFDSKERSIQELKAARNEKEKAAILEAQNDIDRINLQDELFIKFCSLQRALVPHASNDQKIKERYEIEAAYQRQEENFTPEVLKDTYKRYLATSQSKALFAIENKKEYAQLTKERATIKTKVLKKIQEFYQIETYFEKWKTIYSLKRLQSFSALWQGLVAGEVMASFQARTPFIDTTAQEKKSTEIRHYEREALAEQWAIWHHQTFSKHSTKDEKVIRQSFENFTQHMKAYAAKQALIQNPFYDVKQGNVNLSNSQIEAAIAAYQRAIEKDPNHSLYAHYNKARAHLSYGTNKGFQQQQAETELKAAKRLIQNIYRPNLVELNTVLTQASGGGNTSVHIQHHMDILSQVEKHIDSALEVITKAAQQDFDVKISEKIDIGHLLKPLDSHADYTPALDEARNNGLDQVFIIQEVPSTPWWNILLVVLIGVCQIVAGVLITACTGSPLGMGLISEGIGDVITAVTSAISGTFSWTSWCIEKAVNLAVSLICAGWNTLKNAVKAIKQTVQSTISAIKTSSKALKTGLKEAAKQVSKALGKEVAKESLNRLADYACDKLFMQNIEQKISETVAQKLTEALTNNALIQKALAFDVKNNNNYYQDLFIKIGRELLVTKENQLMDFVDGLAKGIVKEKVKYGNRLIQAGFAGHTIKELVIFTDSFLERFQKDVKKYEKEIKATPEQVGSETASAGACPATTTAPGPDVDLDENNLGIHVLEPSQGYSSHQQTPTPDLRNRSVSPSDTKNIVNAFEGIITKKLTASVQKNLVKPVTGELVDQSIKGFTKLAKTAVEAQRKANRRKAKGQLIVLKVDENERRIGSNFPVVINGCLDCSIRLVEQSSRRNSLHKYFQVGQSSLSFPPRNKIRHRTL